MRLRLFPILRGLSPNIRQFSSEAPRASSILTFINRFTTRKAIQRAWAYFLWVPAIIFINDQVVSISPVNGISMRPVLNPDENLGKRDWVILYKFLFKPKRGDVVVLRSPTDPKAWVIKRIIAMEGDIVETRPSYPERNVVVPPNHVWVEGDEAFHSRDSNHYGPITKLLLIGKVEYAIWPRPRTIKNENFAHDRVIFSSSEKGEALSPPDRLEASITSK